jgi:hypothetical protein
MDKKSKKHDLHGLTIEEIRQSYECQKKNNDWTFYQEREFVENLLQTRFNFLIAVYTLFLLAFFQANNNETKMVILFLGLIIVGIMGLVICRTYIQFDIIMKILYKFDEYHVFLIRKKELNARKLKLFDSNPFIGCVIPIFLFLSIIIMGIMIIAFDFKFQ